MCYLLCFIQDCKVKRSQPKLNATQHLYLSKGYQNTVRKKTTQFMLREFQATNLPFSWLPYTGAALCSAHGQCDQIFANVKDGHLRQRKPAGRFEKNNPNLGKPRLSNDGLEVKYAVGKQIKGDIITKMRKILLKIDIN